MEVFMKKRGIKYYVIDGIIFATCFLVSSSLNLPWPLWIVTVIIPCVIFESIWKTKQAKNDK